MEWDSDDEDQLPPDDDDAAAPQPPNDTKDLTWAFKRSKGLGIRYDNK